MPRSVSVALIAEDFAHEAFVRSLVTRLASEANCDVQVSTVSGRGGSGKAISELGAYQRALRSTASAPSLLIVAIDANCKGWNNAHTAITEAIDTDLFPVVSIGCPDPHVEKWYMADAVALEKKFGGSVKSPKKKCARDVYKRALVDYLEDTDNVLTIGGAEFADEIVTAMDLYRAGKTDPALKAFIGSLRNCLKILGREKTP
jgi:hypothetical protein